MNDIEIIHQDNHLMIVNKPAGMLTQPNETAEKSLIDYCKEIIAKEKGKTGAIFLEAIHRIDRPVSGIVVFAKTSKALTRLNASMRNKETDKEYLAIVKGHMRAKNGSLENFLVHDHHCAHLAKEGDRNAKHALLNYQVIKSHADKSLLRIHLLTGRYHQIRIQLSSQGCPIIGDKKYGSKETLKPGVIALHHAKMEIVHPVSKEKIVFQANLPQYFSELIH